MNSFISISISIYLYRYGIPLIAAILIAILSILLSFHTSPQPITPTLVKINNKIKKDQPKVVDTIACNEIEDMVQFKDGKLVMCRCWKSNTFPYCDGSHNAHVSLYSIRLCISIYNNCSHLVYCISILLEQADW